MNNDYVVPSYNMSGYDVTHMTYSGPKAPPNNVLDGWAAILDRDGVVTSSGGLTSNIFYCPDTLNDAGYNDYPHYYDDTSPMGYFDWPATFSSPLGGDKPPAGDPPSPLPIANFGDSQGLYMHELRCSYWINANNPTGATPTAGGAPAPVYYTQSVGYTYSDGSKLTAVKSTIFRRPSALIVAADGIYSGRQSKAQKGQHVTDASAAYRIGYRHNGAAPNTVTNVVFADGHAQPVNTSDMPPSASAIDNSGPYSFLVSH